jgi:uncharacterized protein YndB with AHSA1/START domain
MKRWLWIILGVVIGLPMIAFVVGSFLPRDHVVQMTIDFAAPPAQVWALVSDFPGTPKWRHDVTSIRVDPAGSGGPIRFTESTSQGDVPFEVVSQEPPRRQVVRVVDDDQPFGGTWTWVLEPRDTGTRLTITEAGFIKSPIFRTMGVLFFSPADTLNDYMRALSFALGEKSEPRLGPT